MHSYPPTEVNQELSVLRSQSAKQSEYIGELENKIEDVEKKNRQQSQQMQQQQNRSPTPETAGNYYDPYSRTRSTRIPRTQTSGSLSSSSNPVKMVQEMVGRVRVSGISFQCVLVTKSIHDRVWKHVCNHVVPW